MAYSIHQRTRSLAALERYLGVTDQHKENAIAALDFGQTVSPF